MSVEGVREPARPVELLHHKPAAQDQQGGCGRAEDHAHRHAGHVHLILRRRLATLGEGLLKVTRG